MEDSLETLNSSLTTLTTTLSPLLSSNSNSNNTPLTLLQRAKLHTTQAYAIESLLFSALRLANTSPGAMQTIQSHPIMIELARIKQYFAKIDELEHGRQGPRLRVDKAAAERFVRAGIKDEGDAPAGTSKPHPSSAEIHLHEKRKTESLPSTEAESSKKRKKERKSNDHVKKKSDKMPKGPKEAFQALLNKKK
jgi:exosome complex protein LRP1